MTSPDREAACPSTYPGLVKAEAEFVLTVYRLWLEEQARRAGLVLDEHHRAQLVEESGDGD